MRSKFDKQNQIKYVTGPAKRDQVGTKYTSSQNDAYLEFCVQYLHPASCIMLLIKFFIDDKHFTSMALAHN